MKRINMPCAAKKIIDTLYSFGYDSYIVGGCVRDALLGRRASDFDITTSALPDEVKRIFSRTVDTGIAHGTVTVIEDGEAYEVTTFRIDGEYLDSRHPESVDYTKKIEHDLARRDFTVNALAYNDRVGIVDAYGGVNDLENRLIRCVGEPEKRFSEDALRVLRGIRFSSVLGFDIDEKTHRAIEKYAPRLKNISAERIYAEWKKLLSGKDAYRVIDNYLSVIKVFLPELCGLTMPSRERFESLSWEERQLLLFALSSGSEGFCSAASNLKMESRTRDFGIAVLKSLTITDACSENDVRLYLLGKSDGAALSAARISVAMGRCSDDKARLTEALISADAVRRINQLKIGGRELVSIGLTGENIGKMLEELLRKVALGELENEPAALMSFAKTKIDTE